MRVCTQLHMNIEQRSLRFCLVDSTKGNIGNDFVSCLGLKQLVYLVPRYLVFTLMDLNTQNKCIGVTLLLRRISCMDSSDAQLLQIRIILQLPSKLHRYYTYKEIHYTWYLNHNIPNISLAFFIMVKKKKSRSFQKSFRKKNSIKQEEIRELENTGTNPVEQCHAHFVSKLSPGKSDQMKYCLSCRYRFQTYVKLMPNSLLL